MKFLALFAILAVVIASSECFRIDSLEETTNVDRIYGSKTARPGQFPYMVSLRTATQEKGDISWRRHKCGGAILGDRWIVTAAHCAANSYENISNLAVAVGSHHISNDGQIYRLDQILIHPAYSLAELINDVGLLRTVNRIQFKISLVQSISLRKQIVGADIAAVTSGWGLVKRGSSPKATHLQYLEVRTLTNRECRERQENEYRHMVHDGTLCAFTRRTEGLCRGDSGDPLVANGTLIGLGSWYQPCARGVPDLYARISGFVYWIHKVTGIQAV